MLIMDEESSQDPVESKKKVILKRMPKVNRKIAKRLGDRAVTQ